MLGYLYLYTLHFERFMQVLYMYKLYKCHNLSQEVAIVICSPFGSGFFINYPVYLKGSISRFANPGFYCLQNGILSDVYKVSQN